MSKMDDVKGKLKGFVKKINKPFASTTRFKGEGHLLGSAQDSSSSFGGSSSVNDAGKKQGKARSGEPKQQEGDWRRLQQEKWERERGDGPRSGPGRPQRSKASSKVSRDRQTDSRISNGSDDARLSEALQAQKLGHELSTGTGVDGSQSTTGFDPFRSHIGSVSSDKKAGNLQMFQCPVCQTWFKSEEEVATHLDDCLKSVSTTPPENRTQTTTEDTIGAKNYEEQSRVTLGIFLSGGPPNATIDVIIRIMRNIVNSPESDKFRRIRMGNPKIHDTVGMALGGVELLEAVGFELQTEEDEIWAVMEPPSGDQIRAIEMVYAELERHTSGPIVPGLSKEDQVSRESTIVHRNVDRQLRVFHAASENLAAKMELPDSFFELSAAELRQEAGARRKKAEDSQLLIPKSSREKMAAARKRRYKAAIIRIQFPDGVILQGMFLPREPTSAIHEFVSSSLRDPGNRFDLVVPGQSKSQIIPAYANGGTKIPTLEEADLVPAALLKFQYSEAEALTFTGLRTDLLAAIEPLSSITLPLLVTRF